MQPPTDPPQWGEPGYVPPPPTLAQLAARRRTARRWLLILGPIWLLMLGMTVYGYWTLQPGGDDLGPGMLAAFTFYGAIPLIVLGVRWRKVSKAFRSRAKDDSQPPVA